jgi:hypothetical protein
MDILLICKKANWFFGGPVDINPPQQFNLSAFPTFSALHSSPQVPDAKPLMEGLYCGGSMMKLMYVKTEKKKRGRESERSGRKRKGERKRRIGSLFCPPLRTSSNFLVTFLIFFS